MRENNSILRKPAVQTLLASLVCIVLGVLIGFIALLIINSSGAWEALMEILKNFWNYSKPATQMKNLGNTLVKSAPLPTAQSALAGDGSPACWLRSSQVQSSERFPVC